MYTFCDLNPTIADMTSVDTYYTTGWFEKIELRMKPVQQLNPRYVLAHQ